MDVCNTLPALTCLFLWIYSSVFALSNGVSASNTSPGPLCYSCDLLTDAQTCGHTIRCGRNELCMLHELLPGLDGSKRYIAKCEAESVCESLRNHAKRAYIFCHNCCKQDKCNNHCGLTTTQPTTQKATPKMTTEITTKATTKITTRKPTTKITTRKPTTKITTRKPTTTPKLSLTTTSGHVNYPIMCFSCNAMLDPSLCKHLVPCGTGHACMLQVTGQSTSGQNLYKSSCEPDLLCNAISRSFALIGKRDEVGTLQNMTMDGTNTHELERRNNPCTKCCRAHLCNNQCDLPNQHASTTILHTATDKISATPLHTTMQSATTKVDPTTTHVYKTSSLHSTMKTQANIFSPSYQGCFYDGYNRLLIGTHWSSPRMTIKYCITYCKTLTFEYAGIEHGTECYCGDLNNRLPTASNEDNCAYPCGGDTHFVCGGNSFISIYKTQTLCYKCDAMIQPDGCNEATVCSDDEVCVLYQTEDHLLSRGKLYHAGCSKQQVCDVFSSLPSLHDRYANKEYCHTCCTNSLCNKMCTTLAPTQTTRTTLNHHTVSTTPRLSTPYIQLTPLPPPTTRKPNDERCKQHDFVYIPYISLCFKFEVLMLPHNAAEHWCEQYGATLAILDNPGKCSVMESLLKFEPHFANQVAYIGGLNQYGNNTFYWPNGKHVTVMSLPGPTINDCLSMDGTSGFGMKAVDCNQSRKFICTLDISQ